MQWEDIILNAQRLGTSTRNVFQEEMQKVVLTALARNGCFDKVVFQGGTALRLFYGNPRFSEDIDLVLNEKEEDYDLSSEMPRVEGTALDMFPFLDSVDVRTQKKEAAVQRYVMKTRANDPEQGLRLHIELATVPSRMNHARILDHPPFHPAVRVEDIAEIMADKMVALAFRPYLKGRDLWDIHFMAREKNVDVPWDLVEVKVDDYGYQLSELGDRLNGAVDRISEEGATVLENELKRFLPGQLLEMYGPSFEPVLSSNVELVRDRGPGRTG